MTAEIRPRIAKRMHGVHGEGAFEMLARANELERQGRSIIHLEIGEPDFETPAPIVDAAIDWLRKGATHYAPSPGIPELRRAVADHLSSSHNVQVDPGAVIISPGAKLMIFAVLHSLIDPGDEVIHPDPAYPAYSAAIRIAGATPVPVKLDESKGFRFDLQEVARRVTSRTRMIIINSPQNPTGGVLTIDDLRGVAELARRHDLFVLSDEIYSEIFYGQRPPSMLDLPNVMDRLILVDGFSKTYAMTGWRLGYGVLPHDVSSAVALFINNSVSCTATFSQRAALEAFTRATQTDVDRMVQEFRKRRDVFVNGLNSIPGIHCLSPAGAFYLFPNVARLGKPSGEIADDLLMQAGVSALPGTAFGDYGEGYLRFSFANSLENIERALERIRSFVENL